jgi:aspartate/methionine/tyrosine aminotransferase
MFSTRLHWNLQPNPVTRLLGEKRAAKVEILDLTGSNPTRAQLSYPEPQILAALSDSRSMAYDPSPAGLREAREAIAEYHGGIDPEHIILTASTSEAYGLLFKLLADSGDEVLAPRPSYPLFEFLANLESVRFVQYPLVYHEGWAIDFEALRQHTTDRTRSIVVVNPNNPTGSFLKTDELERLVAFSAEKNIAILSDEVFADYAFRKDPVRVRSLTGVRDALTFSLSGLSKVVGLPQMKLGWIAVSGPDHIRSEALERLELIADTYLSVNTPIQWAASKLLCLRDRIQNQISKRVRDNLAFLKDSIGPESPWSVLDVEGGWYATLRAPKIRTEEDWVLHLLREHDVLVQPGFFFDFDTEAFLIVSLLTSPAVFREGVQRLLVTS